MDIADIPCIDLRGSGQKHPGKGHSTTEEIVKYDNDHCTVEDNNDYVAVEDDNDHVTVEDDNDHVMVEEEVPENEAVQETETESKPGCTNKIEGWESREEVYSQQTSELKVQNEVYENLDIGSTDIQKSIITSESVTWNENSIARKKFDSGLSSYISCKDRKSDVHMYNRLKAHSFYQLPHSGHQPALVNQQVQVPAVLLVLNCRLFFLLANLSEILSAQFSQSQLTLGVNRSSHRFLLPYDDPGQLFYQMLHSGCQPALSDQQIQIEVHNKTQLFFQITRNEYCLLFLQQGNLLEILSAQFSQRQLMLGVKRSSHRFLLPYDDPGQLLCRQRALTFHHELPGENIELLKNPCENHDQNNVVPENIEIKDDEEDRGCSSHFTERDFTEQKVRDGNCLQIGQQLTMPGQYQRKAYRHHAILVNVVTCQGQNVELELIPFIQRGGERDINKTIEKYDLATADLRIIVCLRQRYSPNEIIQRAKSMLNGVAGGKFEKYCLFTNNCEHFAMWCAVGIKKSFQVQNLWVIIENSVVVISFLGITGWIQYCL